MSDTTTRGFTTAILHSDRDAPIEHGALHKPLHLSVAYGYRDAHELAAVFQGRAQGYAYGRQGNPTSAALEAKVTAMEGGVGTVTFATGMAAIGAIMLALLKAGDHVVSSQFVFGNTSSLLLTLEAHGHAVSFVDATDVAKVEAALTPATRLVFVETIANPRVQVADLARIGELCRARGILYVVDNTMTSPWLFQPKYVGASLDRQRAHQVHRRPRQRAGRRITDTGLFDWTRYPNIAEAYKAQPPRNWGLQQLRKKGLRDFGGTLSRRAGASHRGRRGDARAAHGAHLRATRWRSRSGSQRSRRCAPSTTRDSPRIRSTRSRPSSSAATAACCRSSSRTASTRSRS